MMENDLRPSKILTRASFENAMTIIMALGGPDLLLLLLVLLPLQVPT